MRCGKEIGAVLLISGTAIGASMIALPISLARLDLCSSVMLLSFVWLMMLFSVLITLDIFRHLRQTVTMAEAAMQTYGRHLYLVNQACILLLFYSLLSAYSSMLVSIFHAMYGVGMEECCSCIGSIFKVCLFVVFGIMLASSISIADQCNRAIFVLKIMAFLLMVILLYPYVETENLLDDWEARESYYGAAVPVIFTAFGFHGSAPAIADYLGLKHRQLYKIFFLGTLIPLIFYITWECLVSGLLPSHGPISFDALLAEGGNAGQLIHYLSLAAASSHLVVVTDLFAVSAILTSFIGVSISLFHFWEEYNETYNMGWKRSYLSLFTFVPPLCVSLFSPATAFQALGVASIALAVIAIITPCMIMFKVKTQEKAHARSNTMYLALLGVTFFFGCCVIGMGISSLCA